MPVFQSHIGMVVAARQYGSGVRKAESARPTGLGLTVLVHWSSLIIRPFAVYLCGWLLASSAELTRRSVKWRESYGDWDAHLDLWAIAPRYVTGSLE